MWDSPVTSEGLRRGKRKGDIARTVKNRASPRPDPGCDLVPAVVAPVVKSQCVSPSSAGEWFLGPLRDLAEVFLLSDSCHRQGGLV